MPKAQQGWMGISGCIMLNVWRRQRSTSGRRDGPVLEPGEVHVHPLCNAERVFDGTALSLATCECTCHLSPNRCLTELVVLDGFREHYHFHNSSKRNE
jgi:hypothetical protein